MRSALVALLALASTIAAAQETPATPPAPAATAAAPTAPGPPVGADVVVVLRDGQVLRGKLVERDAAGVTLESSGARLSFPASAIRELTVPGTEAAKGPWARDPNRTRYLYSQSGFMLRQWEGYVSQTELLATTVSLGLTDWLTVQVGTVLPVMIYSPPDTPLLLGAKVGGSATPWLHLSAGLSSLVLPSVSEAPWMDLISGTATFGSEDLNLGITAGPVFALSSGTSDIGHTVVAVSGTWRVGRSIALVSENWFLPVDGQTKVVASAAVRFIGDRLGVDAGFVVPEGTSFPVPWLDFTWHWN